MTTTAIQTDIDHGSRTFAADQVLAQIGRGNVLAISGGRIITHTNGIVLPVRYGYRVEIFLAADDTYTVERTRVAAGTRKVHARREGVYCDEIGDVAYRASCYREAL